MDDTIKKMDDTIKKMDDKIQKNFWNHQRQLTGISSGIGIGLERIATAYLQKLMEKEFPNAVVKERLRFRHAGKDYEVDHFCEEASVIAESTSMVDRQEMVKIEKFIEVKKILEARLGKPLKGFFFFYCFHPTIEAKCVQLFEQENIKCINANTISAVKICN